MGSKRRSALSGAAAAVLVCALGACGSGDPQPQFAPPVSTSSTPTTPPTSGSAQPEPEPWQIKSDDGAVAFVKHWVDTFNEAQSSGSIEDLKAISGPACGSCSTFARIIEQAYTNGGHIETAGWMIRTAAPSPGLPSRTARVSFRIHESRQKFVSARKRPSHIFRGGEATYSAELTWSRGAWSMSELLVVPE